jgi:hypothetical protein
LPWRKGSIAFSSLVTRKRVFQSESNRWLSFESPGLRLIFRRVNRLTRQEQLVLIIVLGLLVMGWAVKVYRTAHPPAPPTKSQPASHGDAVAADEETKN